MGDWDLLAVVRGHNNNMESHQLSIINNNIDKFNTMDLLSQSSSSFDSIFPSDLSFQDQDELFNTYPHLFETATAFDELEELYKPFYPGPTTAALVLSSSSNSSLSSLSSSVAVFADSHFDSRQVSDHHLDSSSPKVKIPPASKYKKRKNQQKRVVKEVREDGLSSDMWAWRKYGQKPIKGSPYPRSYYRCSSSKGCSARKQVERSPSNPDTFIITYTAEHSHPHPTRRNSLAGSTRTKFPGPVVLNDNKKNKNKNNDKDIDRDDSTTTTTSSENINVDVKNVVLRHDHGQLFASLDDLERGLEELCDHDEETTSNDHNINNNDYDHDNNNIGYKSELLLDGGFFGDYDDDHEANWFIDQYNTTLTGAC